MQIDLSFYLEPPELIQRGKLTICVLAPLSMVSQQPGSYFRSELSPTKDMLYGLVENAAGWHFHEDQRKVIIKGLVKAVKKKFGKDPPGSIYIRYEKEVLSLATFFATHSPAPLFK